MFGGIPPPAPAYVLQEGAVEQSPSPQIVRRPWIEPLAMLLLALAINFAGNARTGLWDRDEPRYAVAVREMRARGDWFFPTFNGEPRYHKPILIYWLMGMTTAVAGDGPFGLRLVSSMAGAGAVLGVWWLGRRMLGDRGGRIAALVYATAPIVAVESKLATTDATLTLWLVGCQASLWILGRCASRAAAALFWICLSLAILTKGPIGPAFVAVASAVAWCCGWSIPSRERLHLRWGLGVLVMLTCPWFIATEIASHGEFLRFAVGDQIVNRVVSEKETHGGFPGYYPSVSALVLYPWSALLPVGLVGAWTRRKSDPTLAFLLGWIVGPLILLECFRTKLIHYFLPAVPSCALLVAWLMLSLVGPGSDVRRCALGRLSMVMLVGIGGVMAATIVSGAVILPDRLSPPLILIACLILVGVLAGYKDLRRGAGEKAVFEMAGCWAVILLLSAGWVVPMGEPARTSRVVGRRLGEISRSLGIEPVLLEYKEPGVIYELGRPIAIIRDKSGFFDHVEGGRSVATVLLDFEIPVMRNHFGLDVKIVDVIEGYQLTKGRKEMLYLTVVKEDVSSNTQYRGSLATSNALAREKALVE